MTAILTKSIENLKKISELLDKEIIYSNVYKDLEEETEKILRLNIEILIIDSVSYKGDLINSIKKIRMLKNDVRIIIVTDRKQGDKQISNIIKMGVYDVITDIEKIQDIIENKMTFLQASKWEVENALKEDKEKKSTEKTKIIIEQNLIGTALIGVTALKAGAGATHLAIQLATFLAKRKYKVALIELNNSKTIQEMKRIYQISGIEKENGDLYEKNIGFKLGRIDFYPFDEIEIAEIFKRNYQYIIFDFGKYDLSSDIYRCRIKIMVANLHLWEDKLIQKFIAEEENLDTWSLYINAALKDSAYLKAKKVNIVNRIKGEIFEISQQEEEAYKELLKDVIINNEKENKKGIISKILKYRGEKHGQEK